MLAAISTRGKPKAANTLSATTLLNMAPSAPMKVIIPLSNGVSPNDTCSISGSRKGVAPTPMRKIELPTTAERNSG